MMQFPEQHREAIAQTIRVRNEVEAEIFDDKVRSMGAISVSNGEIRIILDSVPAMVDETAAGEFLAASISLGIEACWLARREAFEKR